MNALKAQEGSRIVATLHSKGSKKPHSSGFFNLHFALQVLDFAYKILNFTTDSTDLFTA